MKRVLFFTCVFYTIFHNLNAQSVKFTIDKELAKKYEKMYLDEGAVFLSSEINFEFEWDKNAQQPKVMEYTKERILALKEDQSVYRYKFYNNNTEITEAKRYNDQDKIAALNTTCGNYNADGIFYSDAQVCEYPLGFQEKGEIQNLGTEKVYHDIKYLTSVYFHDELPSLEKKISFLIPDWLTVELKEFNFDGFKIEKSQSYDEIEQATKYEFTIKHIDTFENKKHAPGYSYTYPHILVLTKSFTRENTTQKLLSSVDDLYAWYLEMTQSLQSNKEELKPLVQQLTSSQKSDLDKIKAIFYWVQDNIRYIAFEDGIAAFKPEEAQRVYSNKYGDCKGMANLTKTMLEIAGFDARLTWIGTKKIAYDFSIPSLAINNHMVCTVFLNGEKYILDATEKYNPLGDYAERIQGRPIMIEDGKKYILDKVPDFEATRNKMVSEQTLYIENEMLKGIGKLLIQGERKTTFLYALHNTPKDQQTSLINYVVTSGNKNFKASSIQSSDLDNRDIPLDFHFDFTVQNQITGFGNDLYVDLDLVEEFKNKAIEEERVSDYVFQEKVSIQNTINLQIPEGYKVTHLPEDLNIQQDNFSFKVLFTQNEGKVIYQKKISITNGVIPVEDFESWNQAIKKLVESYEDQVILSKS